MTISEIINKIHTAVCNHNVLVFLIGLVWGATVMWSVISDYPHTALVTIIVAVIVLPVAYIRARKMRDAWGKLPGALYKASDKEQVKE